MVEKLKDNEEAPYILPHTCKPSSKLDSLSMERIVNSFTGSDIFEVISKMIFT